MLRTPNFSRDLLISVCSFLLFSGIARGQITDVTNDQSTPIPGVGHDYIKMFNETVNPANGSVSIRIGVPAPPGRRLTLPFAFAYDSNGVHHPGSTGNGVMLWYSNTTFLSQGGWSYSMPLLSMVPLTKTFFNGQHQIPCLYYTDYMFADPTGGRHALGLSAWDVNYVSLCQQVSPPPHIITAAGDASYQAITPDPRTWQGGNPVPVMTADADGTVYHFPATLGFHVVQGSQAALPDWIEDRNGNKITITDSGGGAFTMTDTLNRSAIQSNGFGTSGNTVTVSGLGSPYTIGWGTVSSNYSVAPKQVGNDSYCLGIGNESGSMPVVTYITLPNGQSYTFGYDTTYGLVSQITYPTGAWVKYTWGLNSQSEFGAYTDTQGSAEACGYTYGSPAVIERRVSFDGTNVALDQTFSYTTTWGSGGGTWTNKTTTVKTTDKLRNQSLSTTYTYGYWTVPMPPNEYSHFSPQVAVEKQIVYQDGSGNTLSTVTKTWGGQSLMTQERTQPNGGGWAEKDYTYSGTLPLLTDKKDYDYAASPPGTLLKETSISYWTPSSSPIFGFTGSGFYQTILDRPSQVVTCNASPCSSSQNRVAETDYAFDGSTLTEVSATNHDDTNYSSSYTNRGNATSKSEWVNTTGSPLTWNYAYDDTGQQVSMTDPKGNPTDYSYSDEFSACGSPSGSTNAYLTKIQDAKGFTQTFTYRFCDGQLSTATDRNNQTTSYSYSDSLARLTEITYPPQGGTATNTYDDGSPTSSIVTSQTTDSSGTTNVTTQVFDGAGHVTRSQLNSDPDCSGSADNNDTAYDGLGRVWKVSNPYCSAAPDQHSTGTTTYTYDALGRTTSIAYPDGSTATSAYSGNTWTVIDPAGMTRTLTYDALGRLTSVVENPGGLGYSTSYSYNALDDLLTVSQGSQTRTFGYDSLSRMTSAANPESGTTNYTYPVPGAVCSGDASAVCTRTDARGISTTYTYNDSLNRLTSKTYPDGTPTANFFYDAAPGTMPSWSGVSFANPNGRLVLTCTGSAAGSCTSPHAATVHSYDSMGRAQDYWQCTPYNCGTSSIWHSNYQYKYTGEVSQWLHPAGYTLTNTVSPARRTTAVQSSWADTNHPQYLAQSINYMPWGAVSKLVNGCAGSGCTNALETYTYNNRLQPWMIQLGSTSGGTSANYCLVYNYFSSWTPPSSCPSSSQLPPTGTTDNGNVTGYWYDDNVNSTLSHTATYAYDHVNRLTSGVATGNSTYNLAFSYTQDLSNGQYGNMSCVTNGNTSGLCTNLSFNAGTNQISSSGYKYDAAGHLTADGTHTYQWDAEGRLASVDNGSTESYTYNALGQQVRLNASSNGSLAYTWDHLYDTTGSWIGRWSGSTWSVSGVFHLGGRPFAIYIDQTYFVHVNALGSTAMTTNSSGSLAGDKLFYPWGQDWAGSSGEWHYAGFQYGDSAAGLYPTLFRQYAAGQGRWLTPDPDSASAQPSDPQTWNVYAYARNNPATLTDPTGEDYRICVHDETNQNRLCTVYESEEPFLQTLKNPGPGITVQGNELSGTIYGTDVNGNRVEAGTYEQVPGHGMEDHGLEHDVAADMAIGGLLSAGLRVGVAAIDWATNGLRNLLGLGSEEATEGGIGAATPVGQRGSPMKVAPGTNAGAEIDGIRYSGHALDQMQSEGIPPSAVKDAIRSGSHVPTYGDRVAHFADGIKAVTARDGTVVTVTLQAR